MEKKESNKHSALLKAMDHLARRDHSEKELRAKLLKKFDPKSVDAAICAAAENGWLPNPEELAQKVLQTLHEKGKGRFYIESYLKEKDLPVPQWNEDLEFSKAKIALERGLNISNFGKKRPLEKCYRFLVNRGFSHNVAQEVSFKYCHQAQLND